MARTIYTAAKLGFEDKLWAAADKLRRNMDIAEYKHVGLGLVSLKYISDAFIKKHGRLIRVTANPDGEYFLKEKSARFGVANDRDEYLAEDILWVPPEARWAYLQKSVKLKRLPARHASLGIGTTTMLASLLFNAHAAQSLEAKPARTEG